MESLYLLIPLSAALVLGILAVFGWALYRGQFDELEREGQRILEDETALAALPVGPLDADQAGARGATEQSRTHTTTPP